MMASFARSSEPGDWATATDRALVVLLPTPIAARADLLRQSYDPNYQLVPPHITLSYPFLVDQETWGSVRLVMSRCLHGIAPFGIRLAGLGVFHGTPSCLWLRPDDDGSLVRIRQKLVLCFPSLVPQLPFEFQPHVTIGAFDRPRDLDRAMETVRESWRPVHFTATHLTYLAADRQGTWCTCGELQLGDARQASLSR